jgi:hypothetical protein
VEIKKSSPPKSKTEANILPNIPKNTKVTVEQHGLSLPKTDTNTKVNTTSDISPITATDLIYCVLCHFQQYFSYIVAVSFIGGGNQ